VPVHPLEGMGTIAVGCEQQAVAETDPTLPAWDNVTAHKIVHARGVVAQDVVCCSSAELLRPSQAATPYPHAHQRAATAHGP